MSDDPPQTPSHRTALNLLGASLAAAPMVLSSNAAAQAQSQPGSSGVRRQGLEDPRSKYPKPPFAQQQQPWPAWRATWIRAPTMVRSAMSDQVGWPDARR